MTSSRATIPGLYPGVHRETRRIFCRKLHTCGSCGTQFNAHRSNGRRPCPRCRSFRRPDE